MKIYFFFYNRLVFSIEVVRQLDSFCCNNSANITNMFLVERTTCWYKIIPLLFGNLHGWIER